MNAHESICLRSVLDCRRFSLRKVVFRFILKVLSSGSLVIFGTKYEYLSVSRDHMDSVAFLYTPYGDVTDVIECPRLDARADFR